MSFGLVELCSFFSPERRDSAVASLILSHTPPLLVFFLGLERFVSWKFFFFDATFGERPGFSAACLCLMYFRAATCQSHGHLLAPRLDLILFRCFLPPFFAQFSADSAHGGVHASVPPL